MGSDSKDSSMQVFPDYEQESQGSRLSRKAKDAPFMVAGLLGLSGIVSYALYGLRQRKVPLSIYLIHTRVMAQGFVVTCLTLGVGYNLYSEYLYPKLVEYQKKFDTAEK